MKGKGAAKRQETRVQEEVLEESTQRGDGPLGSSGCGGRWPFGETGERRRS